jgi:hypothetical protein
MFPHHFVVFSKFGSFYIYAFAVDGAKNVPLIYASLMSLNFFLSNLAVCLYRDIIPARAADGHFSFGTSIAEGTHNVLGSEVFVHSTSTSS